MRHLFLIVLAATVVVAALSCADSPTSTDVARTDGGRPAGEWNWDGVVMGTGGNEPLPCDPETMFDCEATYCEGYGYWAPPLVWGSWQYLTSHIGSITYTVRAQPTYSGNYLTGQVGYWGPSGYQAPLFASSIAFTTSGAGSIEVRHTASPGPTPVNGQYCW